MDQPIAQRPSSWSCPSLDIVSSDEGSSLSEPEIEEFLNDEVFGLENHKRNTGILGSDVRRRRVFECTMPGMFQDLVYEDQDLLESLNPEENIIGCVRIPVGVAGPLKLNGKTYMVPLSTTEGCLVASANRGCRAAFLGNGVTAHVISDQMTRAPVLRFPSAARACDAKAWLEDPGNLQEIQRAFQLGSSPSSGSSGEEFIMLESQNLISVSATPAGKYLFVRFAASTGDDGGEDSITRCTKSALNFLNGNFPDMEILSLYGNFCTEKKPAIVNWIRGRGKGIIAEAIIPQEVVEDVLHTNVQDLVELNTAKNLVGSAMAGCLGGCNAHASNIVAAIFIATGQDLARNVSSSNCITLLEPHGEDGRDLYITCTMPCMEVATVGGGRDLKAQRACLQMLGVDGALSYGENSKLLAQIICATVLVTELSLMAAISTGSLVAAHMRLNRANKSGSCSGARDD